MLIIELLDDLRAEATQPGVTRLHATIANQIADVVGELDDAHAELLELGNPIDIFEQRSGVLESIDQT